MVLIMVMGAQRGGEPLFKRALVRRIVLALIFKRQERREKEK
jgi:hypothetical protein